MKYVLISPARNESTFLEGTIKSVVAQTRLPERWVIVDDGSTDRTGEIADSYAARYPWIEVVHRRNVERSFAGKVHAFNAGWERVKGMTFDVIVNLDADLTFDPDYFDFLMRQFEQDPTLGVAGTPFLENGYDSARDSFEGENHVAGGAQMFRYDCFQQIGGYVPNRAGGIDWVAVTTARMRGWRTRSFQEKRFNHHRVLGTGQHKNILTSLFSYGEKDYYLGGSPIWQIFRIPYRMTKRPIIIGGIALFAGYCWAGVRRIPRAVSPELMRFHRREQMKKLRLLIRSMLRMKVDNFSLATQPGEKAK
ncbi:MAG TPA: glycosyltransferase family 2 protein [Candidatus Didemnitutus sp.]|nr:glycosyltransferase family 2 protein [Candidatus Didemnitutus sp.]